MQAAAKAVFRITGALLCGGAPFLAWAQETAPAAPVPSETTIVAPSPILTIDQERLFAESAFGKRVQAALEADSADLAAENRKIEAELTAEEQDLTAKRATLAPEEFRKLADAFDAKVTSFREGQGEKERALTAEQDTERQRFLEAVLPVLSQIVRDSGAVAILDKRAVFLSAQSIDATDRAIAAIDAAIGDGVTLPQPSTPEIPEPQPAPESGTDQPEAP